MSRSYKKHPVCTDGHRRTTKENKQLANRSVRRRNKQIVDGYFTEDPRYTEMLTLDGKSYTRYWNSWNIHDWISWWSMATAINQFEHPNWLYNPNIGGWFHPYDEYSSIYDFISYWEKYYKRK